MHDDSTYMYVFNRLYKSSWSVHNLEHDLIPCARQDSEDTSIQGADVREEEPKAKPRTATVDLQTDTSLMVDISDALSEQEKVKFTVHTKVGGHCYSMSL